MPVTHDNIDNFQLPKEILENRVKRWDNLFTKYSEMSNDIEINMNTLQPEEDEEEYEEEHSEGDHNHGWQASICKSATFIQYWVDTGNIPYKILMDKKESSETGLSLSEEEISSPSYSSLSNKIDRNGEPKCENDTSFSSVDTAAYILSNANITKKADTIAIIEGAKSNGAESVEDDCIIDTRTSQSDNIENIQTTETNHVIHNENTKDTLCDNLFSIPMENAVLETNNQLDTSEIIPADTIQPNNVTQNSLLNINKSIISTSQKSTDLHSIDDIASIFRQFNEASKRFPVHTKNYTSDKSKMFEEHDSSKQSGSQNTTEDTTREDTNLIVGNRKKLYTGRDSPVDLVLNRKHSTDLKQAKLSNTKLNSHPALDTDNLIVKESSVQKGRNKLALDNSTLDPTLNNSNIIFSSNSVGKKDSDNLTSDNNSIKNIPQKYDTTSLNLNPVVVLERFASLEKYMARFDKTHITEKGGAQSNLNLSKLHARRCNNMELTSIDSDQSTILLYECNNIVLPADCSSSSSSFQLRISNDGGCSPPRINEIMENIELANVKSVDLNQNKESPVTKRLSQSVIKNADAKQASNADNNLPVGPRKLLNKSKNSSDSHRTNVKNNVKLRELKVELLLLSPKCFPKESTNVASTSLPAGENRVEQNTSKKDNKETSKNTIRSSVDKNKQTPSPIRCPVGKNKKTSTPVRKINSYSLRTSTRSKKNSNEASSTSGDSIKYDTRIPIEVQSNYTLRCKSDCNRANEDEHRGLSVLKFISSDEDDLVQLIRTTRRRLKTIRDDRTSETSTTEKDLHNEAKLLSTIKPKSNSNKGVRRIICSSKQSDLKRIDKTTKKNNGRGSVKRKFASDEWSDDSFQMRKPKKIFLHRRNNSNSIAKNSNKRQKINLFSNGKDTSYNSDRHLRKTIRNGENYDNSTCITLFQTKTFNTDSSDSDRSNNDIPTRKSTRTASIRGRTRRNNHFSKGKLFKDNYSKMFDNESDASSSAKNNATRRYNTRMKSSRNNFCSKMFDSESNTPSSAENNATRRHNTRRKSPRNDYCSKMFDSESDMSSSAKNNVTKKYNTRRKSSRNDFCLKMVDNESDASSSAKSNVTKKYNTRRKSSRNDFCLKMFDSESDVSSSAENNAAKRYNTRRKSRINYYSKIFGSELDASGTAENNVANRIYNTRSSTANIAAEINRYFDKKSNENNVNSRTSSPTKTSSYLSALNNTRKALVRKTNVIPNISLRNSDLSSKALRSSTKANLESSQINHQHKSTIRKCLFQTKNYYDSDSSVC